MEAQKTNLNSAIEHRMTDAQYIKHLEESIQVIHGKVNSFINKMDEATRASTIAVFDTYVSEVKNLRF